VAYTVNQLITRAYYKAGIVSPDLAVVSDTQTSQGLLDLNELIADKTIEDNCIPYYTKYDFFLVIGQQEYFIPKLISTNTATFFLNSVRFSLSKQTRDQFYGSSRALNINSLPAAWNLEACLGGAILSYYFWPDQAYPAQIVAQFRLDSVTINEDLSLTLDQFYINFLMYCLAERLCETWGYTVPPQTAKKLAEYYDNIQSNISPLDTTIIKSSMLQRKPGLNYAQVNLGRGWSPS